MNNLVSILIPTYNRPQFLLQCVQSAVGQTYKEIEVIVSDDSKTDESEMLLKKHGLLEKIRYVRNEPSLREVANVNRLFSMATGDRLILVHDDDWLLPNAVEDMSRAWEIDPETNVCYGLQKWANDSGEINEENSDNINLQYYRTPEYFGVQKEILFSALMGQLPNNCSMIRSSLVRKLGLKEPAACDFEFGLRLGLAGGIWQLVPSFVSVVRASDESFLRTKGKVSATHSNEIVWNLIKNYPLPKHLEKWRELRLQSYAHGVVEERLVKGRRVKAARVLFSKQYDFRNRQGKKKYLLLPMLILPAAFNRYIVNNIINR